MAGCDPRGVYRYEAIDGKLYLKDGTGRIVDHNPNRPGGMVTVMPIIDPKSPGFDSAKYETDQRECRDIAGQVRERTLESAVTGAALGAGVGAAVGHSVGFAGAGAQSGAATGGITGLVSGSAGTQSGHAVVMVRCLEGRGYRVLGVE